MTIDTARVRQQISENLYNGMPGSDIGLIGVALGIGCDILDELRQLARYSKHGELTVDELAKIASLRPGAFRRGLAELFYPSTPPSEVFIEPRPPWITRAMSVAPPGSFIRADDPRTGTERRKGNYSYNDLNRRWPGERRGGTIKP